MAKRFRKYNPAFLKEEDLTKGFVVRHADLDLIIRIISENVTDSNQHVLVIGPRGSGKTTLVLRIAAEVERTEGLRDSWYPLIFSEESYKVASAADFWLEALFHLKDQTGDDKWTRTYNELKNETDDQRLGERALWQLLDFADSQGKRILLIVENLNMLFSDLISEDEAWKIRHTLINEPRLMLLATATSRFENIENSSHAMFEMFKMHELKPLDDDECNSIWELIAGKKLIGQQIRPVRILTGGNPRLLTIIAKFGAHRSFKRLLDDLVDLIDDHTDYFKSHLDNMPSIERKVYLALAELWTLSTAREIAKEARLEVSKTSSLLNRLIGRGAVVAEDQGKRTKWYRITEGIYNIYYLMRRRGKPADRVKATVKFMVSMYDPESVTRLIAEEACRLSPELCGDHYLAYEEVIKNVSDHNLREKIIASAPKSFLKSSHISEALKIFVTDDVKIQTVEDVELKKAMEIIEQGYKFFKKGNYEDAIEKLDKAIEEWRHSDSAMLISEVARAMVNKGISLGALNRTDEEIQMCDEVIATYKDRPEPQIAEKVAMAMVNKGVSLEELNRTDEAIQVYDEVVAIYRDWPESQIAEKVAMSMVNKGVSLGALNRMDEAIQVYDEVIALYKDRPELQIAELIAMAMVNKAVSLGALNRMDEAIQVYDEVIALYKDRSELQIAELIAMAMVNKAVSLGTLKRYEEAEIAFMNVIKLKPDFTVAYIRLIELLLKMPERYKDAMQTSEEIIGRKPGDQALLNYVSWAFYKHRDLSLLQKAEKWARQAVSISPDNASIHHTLACILSALGKGSEALESAKKYIQDTALVQTSIEDAIELFVELAASGYAKEALGILVNSPAEKHLEPLVVALKLYVGDDVKTAVEILEVAKDVVKRIEERRGKREEIVK